MSPAVGEGDDAADLVLGEGLVGDHLGVRLRLDPEGLVVGEVQAELVELEVAHLAYAVLYPLRAVVLARDVEVESALRAVGPVVDDALGEGAVRLEGLLERTGAVEDARLVGSGDLHLPVAHGERVRLGGARVLVAERQLDVSRRSRLGAPVADLQLLGEQLRLVGEHPAALGDDDGAVPAGLPAGAAGRGVLAHRGDRARCAGHRIAAGGRRGGLGGGAGGRRRVAGRSAAGPVRPDDDGEGDGGRGRDSRAGDEGTTRGRHRTDSSVEGVRDGGNG